MLADEYKAIVSTDGEYCLVSLNTAALTPRRVLDLLYMSCFSHGKEVG